MRLLFALGGGGSEAEDAILGFLGFVPMAAGVFLSTFPGGVQWREKRERLGTSWKLDVHACGNTSA